MIVDRKRLEDAEEQTLASYAEKSGMFRGRCHAEKKRAWRTPFQRDRDRIVHSKAFRRLEYKTQVFVYHEGDHYRTRLTHTMETAGVSETIARNLGANQDLAAAIALAHDLGHPPFGHCGEEALNVLMRDHGGFQHNRQSLRVIDQLEWRYPAFPGLNLTWETREGIAKHNAPHGFDLNDFQPGKYASVEPRVANLADEIAYQFPRPRRWRQRGHTQSRSAVRTGRMGRRDSRRSGKGSEPGFHAAAVPDHTGADQPADHRRRPDDAWEPGTPRREVS